jgi:hypothetical protein
MLSAARSAVATARVVRPREVALAKATAKSLRARQVEGALACKHAGTEPWRLERGRQFASMTRAELAERVKEAAMERWPVRERAAPALWSASSCLATQELFAIGAAGVATAASAAFWKSAEVVHNVDALKGEVKAVEARTNTLVVELFKETEARTSTAIKESEARTSTAIKESEARTSTAIKEMSTAIKELSNAKAVAEATPQKRWFR